MASIQEPGAPGSSVPPFRVDGELHELLTQPLPVAGGLPPSLATPKVLPEPVCPRHPELLVEDHPDDWDSRAHPENPYRRRWTAPLIYRSTRGWLFPYIKSRVLPHDFHPIMAYLFTEWKCNLDCHYCWAFDNHVTGMTEDTAKRSIDWLCEKNCSGYKIVNSIRRLQDMKDFMRGEVEPWNCRAGQNSLVIRVDGSLAPCFPMYSAAYDWGTVEKPKFEVEQLDQMKQSCQRTASQPLTTTSATVTTTPVSFGGH